MDWLLDAINLVFEKIGAAGSAITGWLPASPLHWAADVDSQILAWVNWLIPIGEMIIAAETWLVCIGLWYVIRIPLHWIKAASN